MISCRMPNSVFCRHLEDVVDQRTAELISLQRRNAEVGTGRSEADEGPFHQVFSSLSHILVVGSRTWILPAHDMTDMSWWARVITSPPRISRNMEREFLGLQMRECLPRCFVEGLGQKR